MKPSLPESPIRESLAGLPAIVQPFFTWLSGKPRVGETPLWHWTLATRGLATTLALASGLAIGSFALHSGALYLLLLPISWILTTGAARSFYIVIGHYAAHGLLATSAFWNRFFGELTSTVFTTISFDDYRRDHARYHHSWRLGTPFDPDVRFLHRHGFGPGRPRRALWRRLLWTLISPRYHLDYALARLRSNLITAPLYRRALAATYLTAMLLAVGLSGAWREWTLLWLVPVGFGFHMSALLQFLSEHRWWMERGRDRRTLGRMTFGRFLGDALPDGSDRSLRRRILAWLRFWLRVVFVHLPARLFVLVGDLPQHDLHHRRLRSDPANGAHARQADVEAGTPGWPEPYFEVWGSLADAIDQVFCEWARRHPLTDEERRELTAPQ